MERQPKALLEATQGIIKRGKEWDVTLTADMIARMDGILRRPKPEKRTAKDTLIFKQKS